MAVKCRHTIILKTFYCDSGMIPWLLLIELLSVTGKSLAELVDDYIQDFPSSGERNFRLDKTNAATISQGLEQKYAHLNPQKYLRWTELGFW